MVANLEESVLQTGHLPQVGERNGVADRASWGANESLDAVNSCQRTDRVHGPLRGPRIGS